MDLLLTHGYFLHADPHERQIMKPYPPLGILYLSSHLKAKGFDVEIFDSTFSSKEAFHEYVKREKPSLVGLYCNLMTRHNVIEMAQICKENGATVIAGGPEPVNYPEEYLSRGVDVIISGEGEYTLEDLIPHLVKHGPGGDMRCIPGVIYRDQDGVLVHTPAREQIKDLSAQPFPDRAAIDLPRYVDVWRTHHGTGSVSLITARGCPYKCKWCSHSVFGYTHRRRTPLNTADELEHILTTYHPEIVWYADDVFTMNHRWLTEYSAELQRRNLRAPFETISREDRLNEQVIQTLAEMGCYRIWLGAESGSQRILDAMERKTSAQGTRDMAKLLKKYGIGVGMFIMLGYEGESVADLEETIAHLKESNPDLFLTTIAYPIKGTPYYNEVQDRVIPLKAWDEGSDRDFTVSGRYSRKFYRHATRWMVGEVNLARQLSSGKRAPIQWAKSFANAKLGRLGMIMTQNEREK